MRSTAKALFAALLAVLAILGTPPALAQSDDEIFTVSGVDVDETADNAMTARDKAFTKVQQIAFRRLMERLVAEGGGQVAQPKGRQLEALVRDVIVESERSSNVRYIASFTVRFKPDAIRALLGQAGTSYVDDRRAPLVVVPVLMTPTGPVLWDDPNPWREAWSHRPADGLVPFVVPLGELEDVTTLSAAQAVAGNTTALSALAQRHGSLDAMVAVARITTGADGEKLVEIRTRAVGPTAPPPGSVQVKAEPRESRSALLDRAAGLVAADIEARHKNAAALPADGILTQVSALVPLSNMGDWLSVRSRLAALPQIRKLEILSLSRREAALILHTGAPDQLGDALRQAGFGVPPVFDGVAWTLYPSAEAMPEPAIAPSPMPPAPGHPVQPAPAQPAPGGRPPAAPIQGGLWR